FIVSSDNMTEDMPQIRSLLVQPGQDPSMALLEFMIGNYVKNREEYDIEKFDRNMNGIKTQSTQEVFDEYQNYVDPRNPESPITRYQRHSIKKVQILSTNYYEADDEKTMEVLYEAEVESKNSLKKSRWQAKISFIYSGIELDESKGEISPLTFIVTRYETKRLQDIQ
ncbi:MAG: VirB8/TrbF family protein, partial [Alphaproteobacteria bacterium]